MLWDGLLKVYGIDPEVFAWAWETASDPPDAAARLAGVAATLRRNPMPAETVKAVAAGMAAAGVPLRRFRRPGSALTAAAERVTLAVEAVRAGMRMAAPPLAAPTAPPLAAPPVRPAAGRPGPAATIQRLIAEGKL